MSAHQKHPTPVQQLVPLLATARARGADFDDAWTDALCAIRWPTDGEARRDWKAAVRETEGEWRACFARQPTQTGRIVSLMRDGRDQFVPIQHPASEGRAA